MRDTHLCSAVVPMDHDPYGLGWQDSPRMAPKGVQRTLRSKSDALRMCAPACSTGSSIRKDVEVLRHLDAGRLCGWVRWLVGVWVDGRKGAYVCGERERGFDEHLDDGVGCAPLTALFISAMIPS